MKSLQAEIEVSLTEKKDLKQQIKELRSQRDLYEKIFNLLSDGIFVLSSHNIVLYANKAAQKSLGLDSSWNEEESLKKSFLWEIFEITSSLDFLTFHKEVELLEPELKYLSITCIPLESSFEGANRILFIKDITRQKQMQTREVCPDFVDNLTFSAGIAHELGNPIAALSLHAQILERLEGKNRKTKSDREQAKNSLSTLNRELSRLDATLHDFLDAVRPVNPRFTLHPIQSVITQIFETLKAKADSLRVRFRLIQKEELPPFFIDETRVKQALTNVLLNALEVSPENCSVEVEISARKDCCEILIRDFGKGIAAEEISKIFDPFYTTKETGNGLGLLVTYRVLKDHGGSISVKSKPGEGTTFTLSLPLRFRAVEQLPGGTVSPQESL